MIMKKLFFKFWNNSKTVKQLDKISRKFNNFTKRNVIPIKLIPFDWWPVVIMREPVFGKFHKRVKSCYNPNRWGGRFLVIEIGSRG